MIKETKYRNWNAVALETDEAELVIPADIGPRVLRAGFKNGPNLFASDEDAPGGPGKSGWRIYGGHRLWHAPEHLERTYVPDNDPVEWEKCNDNGVLLRQAAEKPTGIAKSIRAEALGPRAFKLTHTLKNENLWPVGCAVWALSVLKHGGYAAIPLPPKGKHPEALLPGYHIVPWPYTDFSHPCWDFHSGYIGIDVAQAAASQKIGISNYSGWSAYWQEGGTFVKYAPVVRGAPYPDFGCAFEAYCCNWMIELETLSPLLNVMPGQFIQQAEYWLLLKGLPKPDNDEAFRQDFRPEIEKQLKEITG